MIRTNLNENLPEKLDLCAECAEQLFFHMSEKNIVLQKFQIPVFLLFISIKKNKLKFQIGKNFCFLFVCVFSVFKCYLFKCTIIPSILCV